MLGNPIRKGKYVESTKKDACTNNSPIAVTDTPNLLNPLRLFLFLHTALILGSTLAMKNR